MLPRADLSITPVGRTEPTARLDGVADPRQEAFQRSMSSLVGRQVQGEVLARLHDGSYLVKLAGTAARMQLPAGAEPGAKLPMTLVTLTPRPTFQLGVQGQPGPQSQIEAEPAPPGASAPYLAGAGVSARAHSAAGLLAPATVLPGQTGVPAAALPDPHPGAAPVTLSATAKVLSGVLGMAQAAPAQADSIVGKVALMPRPGAAPEQLAGALKDAVGKSGLFYESHVAQWSSGARALADLRDEPQMQRALTAGAEAARTAAASDPTAAAAQMINLQLQTQEQARVAWQGQLWPGQDMRWEIQRDTEDERAPRDGEAPEPGWQSALRLRFPLLGDIGARFLLRGGQIHVQIDAGADSVDLLRAQAGRLEAAMDAAGTPLSSLSIAIPREPDHG